MRPRSPSRPAARVLLAVALASVLVGCGSDGGPDAADDPAGESPAGPTTTCDYPASEQPASAEVDAPSTDAPEEGEVDVTLATSQGDIAMTLDTAAAPCTVHSFVSLAEQSYYDDVACHRLTTEGIFVLQCGDPTGTGGGGPGYTFADELTGEETYPAGTVAMANAGPDTNGSQFFLVYEDTQLPPSYTVFGTMDEAGTDVVGEVAAAGAEGGAPDGPPATEVVIESVGIG